MVEEVATPSNGKSSSAIMSLYTKQQKLKTRGKTTITLVTLPPPSLRMTILPL
jgi:hypothetical protein